VFCQELFEEDSDTQSKDNNDATVQGGICALDVFELREKQIIDVKRKKTNKPRKTVSKLVSGRELSNDTVMANIADHEKTQKAKTQPKSKEAKAPKVPTCSSQQPGTSRTTPAAASITSVTDDNDDGDDEICCVCGLFQPVELANHVSLTFVKWAQCDGKVNGRPCLH